jgi:isoaspartyl peptidase/L-asparaginase-like protein (Ntn-hydrolase superfamily)
MSFSVTYIGKPDAIKRALAKESERLTEQSKEEFDAVRPAIEAVLDQNVGQTGVLKVEANGHASFTGTGDERVKTFGNCTVKIEPIYGVLTD